LEVGGWLWLVVHVRDRDDGETGLRGVEEFVGKLWWLKGRAAVDGPRGPQVVPAMLPTHPWRARNMCGVWGWAGEPED